MIQLKDSYFSQWIINKWKKLIHPQAAGLLEIDNSILHVYRFFTSSVNNDTGEGVCAEREVREWDYSNRRLVPGVSFWLICYAEQ